MATDKATKEVLGYRLYDILNILALQMEEKGSSTEELIIRAFNNHTKQYNVLTVTLRGDSN